MIVVLITLQHSNVCATLTGGVNDGILVFVLLSLHSKTD